MVGLTGTAKAQSNNWGTSIWTNPVGYDSHGNALNTSFTLALGWFNDGFTPTASNWADWQANFNVLQTHDPGVQFNAGLGANVYGFFETFTSDSNGAHPEYNKQAYILGYNDMGLIGTPCFEGILFTENNFKYNSVVNAPAATFDIANNPNDSRDDAFTVIFGQVDRTIEGPGGVSTGGGLIHNQLPDATNVEWEYQTATFAQIPEASTVSVLGLLGATLLLRRRRK